MFRWTIARARFFFLYAGCCIVFCVSSCGLKFCALKRNFMNNTKRNIKAIENNKTLCLKKKNKIIEKKKKIKNTQNLVTWFCQTKIIPSSNYANVAFFHSNLYFFLSISLSRDWCGFSSFTNSKWQPRFQLLYNFSIYLAKTNKNAFHLYAVFRLFTHFFFIRDVCVCVIFQLVFSKVLIISMKRFFF